MTQDGKPTIGASLVRPYPEARVLFVDHVGQMFYVYWIDHRLLAPRVES